MGSRQAMFLGLSGLMVVLMMGQADAECCKWHRRGSDRVCDDCSVLRDFPYLEFCCGYRSCNPFCCNCVGGCRKGSCAEDKRSIAEEKALPGRGFEDHHVCNNIERLKEGACNFLDQLQDKYASHRRLFGGHDVNGDAMLSEEEALEALKTMGKDVSSLVADWFTSTDTNGNGFIDPEEYDADMAESMK